MFFSLSHYLRVRSLGKKPFWTMLKTFQSFENAAYFITPLPHKFPVYVFPKWPLYDEGKRSLFQYIFIMTINPC